MMIDDDTLKQLLRILRGPWSRTEGQDAGAGDQCTVVIGWHGYRFVRTVSILKRRSIQFSAFVGLL